MLCADSHFILNSVSLNEFDIFSGEEKRVRNCLQMHKYKNILVFFCFCFLNVDKVIGFDVLSPCF